MIKSKKQSFFQGVLTLMFSQVLIKILGLVYKLYLTNKEGFGDAGNAVYSSGFQIYALLLTISSIGVPNAVAKLISEKISIGDEKGATKILIISLAMFSIIGFVSSAILYFCAEYIACEILQIPEAGLSLQVLAPSIFFVSVISVLRGYFNARENMKPTASSQTIEQLAKTVITILIVEIICAYINTTNKIETMAAGANLATTLGTLISFIYLVLYYKRYKQNIKQLNNRVKSDRVLTIVKNIIMVAMPITITAILGSINKNIDSVTVVSGLKNFMNDEEAKIQYGILSGKVETLISLPMSFNIALSTTLVPVISSAIAKRNFKIVENKIKFAILTTILIGLPCTVGMIIFAEPILNLLFPNASSGTFIYQVSSISIIFILLNQTMCGILQGLGKQGVPAISLLIGVVFKLIVNLTLIPINPSKFVLGGTVGASIGTIICYCISLIINFCVLKRNINIKFEKNKFIIKPLVSTFFMMIVSIFTFNMFSRIMIEKVATILSIFISAIFYIICLILIKNLEKEEIENIEILRFLAHK